MSKILVNYKFRDRTGDYITRVAIESHGDRRFVAAFEDFPNVALLHRRKIDIYYHIIPMLKRLFLEEDGIYIHGVYEINRQSIH